MSIIKQHFQVFYREKSLSLSDDSELDRAATAAFGSLTKKYYPQLQTLLTDSIFLTEREEDCEDEQEYGFDENEKELAEAILNSKVNQTRNKSIREFLSDLSLEALRMG